MRTCKTCRFVQKSTVEAYWRCKRLVDLDEVNPLSGKPMTRAPRALGYSSTRCADLRKQGADCGPLGLLYEPKLLYRIMSWFPWPFGRAREDA